MNWVETVIVMTIGVAGLVMFCAGYLTIHDGLAVGGLGLYFGIWAYSLHRVYHAVHRTS